MDGGTHKLDGDLLFVLDVGACRRTEIQQRLIGLANCWCKETKQKSIIHVAGMNHGRSPRRSQCRWDSQHWNLRHRWAAIASDVSTSAKSPPWWPPRVSTSTACSKSQTRQSPLSPPQAPATTKSSSSCPPRSRVNAKMHGFVKEVI
jgi:hypothetical protein